MLTSESRLYFKDQIIARSGKWLQPCRLNDISVIALLNREDVHSIVQTLGIESLLVLPFATRHLNRSKVVAWKMTIMK